MGYTIHHERTHSIDPEYRNFVVMNRSNHSYAINPKITQIYTKDSWKNKPCMIIGGGVSLKGFNFELLKEWNTIGINKSFLWFSPTINYSMDSDFYEGIYNGRYDEQEKCKVAEKWQAFLGKKIFLTPMELKEFSHKDVYLVRRNWQPSVNRDNLDEGIYGGTNSATGAINLAYALGCREIYLLGYDMHCETQSHWHNGYPNRDLKEFNSKLEGYKKEIEGLAPMWEANGTMILNLNPTSALKCFAFGNLERILNVPNI